MTTPSNRHKAEAHTAGPFKYLETPNGMFDIVTDYQRTEILYIGTIVREKDARLLASAPALRDSLAECVSALEKIDSNAAESAEWIRMVAREALAKAKAIQ